MASTSPPPPNAEPPASPTSPPPLTTTTPSPRAASPSPRLDVNPPSTPATPPQSLPPQSAPPPVPAPPPLNLSSPPSSPPSNVTPPPSPPQPVSPPPSPPLPPPSNEAIISPPPPNEAPSPTPIISPPTPNEAPPPTPIISPPPPNDPNPPVVPPPGVPPVASPPPPIATPPPSVPPAPVNSPPPPVKSPPPPSTRATSSPPPPPPPISPENSPPPPSLSPSNPPATSQSPPPPSPPNTLSPPPPLGPQKPPSPPAPTPPNDPPPPASRPTLSPPSDLSPPPQQAVSPPPPTNGTSPPPPLPSTSGSNNGIGTPGVVAIGVAVGILVISLIGFAIWCCKRRGKKGFQSSKDHTMPAPSASSAATDSTVVKIQYSAPFMSSSGSDLVYIAQEQGGLGNSRGWFSYDELDKATNGFSYLLGQGGFGSVYKGCLPDGKEIAVKVLKVGQGHGEREFKAEVEIISRIHHRNLVSLVGCCIADERKLLVYDYVPNNTLYFHLHGDGRPALDWATRVKIAAGAARGIAYLHEDCHPRIIHRDIKSSNILLDNNFEARVSDFGLAKLTQDAHTHITTRVMGTFGYMAPEYALSGKLTEKSDVYSFGVVLLELIAGRKSVDTSQPLGNESLVEWARLLLNHALDNEEFEGLADPRLEKNYNESEMFRMIEAAAACVRHSAAKRPRMGQIVRAFDDMTARDLTNGMRFGESEEFNTAQQPLEPRLFRRMQSGSKDNKSTENFSRSSTEYFSQNSTEYFSQSNTENFSQTSFDSSK